MSNRIQFVDAGTLMRQAPATIYEYFTEAIRVIDAAFGEGYAKKHPELVSAFITACTQDFETAMKAKYLSVLSDSIEFHGTQIKESLKTV